MSITKATLITSSQAFTGSVVKMQALGKPDASCSLARVEYGSQDGHVLYNNGYTASAVLDFETPIELTIPTGFEISGPINRVKSTGSDSKWLVYHK